MIRSLKKGRGFVIAAATVALAAGSVAVMPAAASASVPTATDPGVAAANKALSYVSTMPTQIPIKVRLTKRPPTGKKVFVVHNSSSQNTQLYNGLSAASAVLGWSPTRLTYPANPADAVGLVRQAIQQGADYIAVQGTEVPVLQPAIDAARAANIPIFLISTAAVPAGKANWIFSSVGNTREWVPRGELTAAMATSLGNGKGTILTFNVPQFEIFQVWQTSFETTLKKLCPACTISGRVNVPFGDVFNGNGSSAVIAYLRSHPEVTQVACSNGTWCVDFPAKAAAAGIKLGVGGVSFYNASVNVAQLPQIANGSVNMAIASPIEYLGWQTIDAMARYSVGDSIVPNWNSRAPLWLRTSKNTTADSQMYAGPVNYTGQFKRLWRR